MLNGGVPTTLTYWAEAAFDCSWESLENKKLSIFPEETSRGIDGMGGAYIHYGGSASVLCHKNTGPYEVHGGIHTKYYSVGGPSGQLGYPISDETPSPYGPYSNFENGAVCWIPGSGGGEVRMGAKGPGGCGPDTDGDGITDDLDQCDTVAENYTGYQDTDDCPDIHPDNKDTDGDGIRDGIDQCKTQTEIFNDYQNTDGYPPSAPEESDYSLDDSRLK